MIFNCIDNEDENVVLEGSDLHKALTEMGCTDFECIPVARIGLNNFWDKVNDNVEMSTSPRQEWLWRWVKKLTNYHWNFWNHAEKTIESHRSKNIQLILELDSLLDDHLLNIQSIFEKKLLLTSRQSMTGHLKIILSLMVGLSALVYKPLKCFGLITVPSIIFFISHQKYTELLSTRMLKDVIFILNNVHYLHKRSLKILKNGYCMKLSKNKLQKQFSNLEVGRLKYLQPLCETLVQSMQTMIRIFYNTSVSIIKFLPTNMSNLMSQLEATAFIISGEVTCEKLNELYYVYILTQSDMVHLFAMLYSQTDCTHRNNLQVIKIIKEIFPILEKYKCRLTNIIEQYKSCKTLSIQRDFRKTGTRWQDLYMHIELLSRKIQSAYDKIHLIIQHLDEIQYSNSDFHDEIVDLLERKMCEIYKEIDTAKNFAEFNSLLLGKFRNRQLNNSENTAEMSLVIANENLPIVRDTEPQIIDEVFEEYVKEEYLKPLCAEADLDVMERVKLDKLLEKNFMSELKEVLIDKYHAMAEREAKALSRYRKNINKTKDDLINVDNQELMPYPPLLPNIGAKKKACLQNIQYNSPPVVDSSQRCLEIPENFNDNDNNYQQFSLDNVIKNTKFSVCTRDEETFIGCGENSEDEINN